MELMQAIEDLMKWVIKEHPYIWLLTGCFLFICSQVLGRFLTEIKQPIGAEEYVALILMGLMSSLFGPFSAFFLLVAILSAMEENSDM